MTAPDRPIRDDAGAEPMLAAEWWLVGGSLALGAALLGVLLWASRTYFPAGG